MAKITYELIRSDRKTLSLQISPQGALRVRCPRRMPISQVEAFLREKQDWIQKTLNKIAAQPHLPRLTDQEIKELKARGREVFPQRVRFFAERMGVSYGTITLRTQKSRWGSCSREGNLNFNILLLLAPARVLDYVVVHELCHRKEMNHSPAFWAQVAQVLPDYKADKKWLKDNGGGLMARAFGEDAL